MSLLSLRIHFNTQVLPSYRPTKATIRRWNSQLLDSFADKLTRMKPTETVTLAGPPGYVDKPWWWGKLI